MSWVSKTLRALSHLFNLAMNILFHSWGSGVHGHIYQVGIMTATQSNFQNHCCSVHTLSLFDLMRFVRCLFREVDSK